MPTAPHRSRLADPQGIYSIVAVDQRESLRVMLDGKDGVPASDQELSEFKVLVAESLSSRATGMLVDLDYGLDPIVRAGVLAPTCPVIAAVDRITYDTNGMTVATSVRTELLDRTWDPQIAGLKLLVLWSPSGWIGCTADDVRRYIAAARDAGLDSVLEVLVRDRAGQVPSPESQAGLLVEAARDLAGYTPTLYKTEVPFRAAAASEQVTAVSRQITEALGCPWVVLSSGVAAEGFPQAVSDTRAGGASGFLAGRAIWGAAARAVAEDRRALLRGPAVDALEKLIDAAHSPSPTR